MNLLKRLPVQLALLALLMGALAVTAIGATSRQCAPGAAANGDYCAGNSNADDPPPATPPAVEPPAEGQPTTVSGTLSGGTAEVEVTNSSNDPGTAEVAVNLAGQGTLIVHVGDQTITVVVAPDGTTTITPEGGDPITVSGPGDTTPGKIVVTVTPDGVSYKFTTPGTKEIRIGNAKAKIPGTATITKGNGTTTYALHGSGSCSATLDPVVDNEFNAAEDIQCTIESPGGTSSRRVVAAAAAGNFKDVIKTGGRNDRISAGPGADLVNAGGGNDLIRGDHSLASMNLRAGARRAYAAAISRISGADVLFGGDGNDRVFGDGGKDTIIGGKGADRLQGNLGNDAVSGGDGNDTIDGGAGRDSIHGGNGDDKIYARGNGLDSIDCGNGRDEVWAGNRDRVFSNCETVHRAG
ncbi:MAG: calcium-binding protein [Solirubrobacterales bacterium]|nr:calcium-binding protein [Solirubrobacterales bacterium]